MVHTHTIQNWFFCTKGRPIFYLPKQYYSETQFNNAECYYKFSFPEQLSHKNNRLQSSLAITFQMFFHLKFDPDNDKMTYILKSNTLPGSKGYMK